MLLRSIGKCLVSRSKKANLFSQIPLKSGLISRPVVRSGLPLNSLASNKSASPAISTRSYHIFATALAKRPNVDRNELENGDNVKPVDFGKPVQRVAKIIASYGQCTKAQAEVLIEQGRVKVNGEVIKEVPTKVPLDSKIYVDDVLLKKPRPRVFIHYKKKMFLAKLSFEPDPKGRRNLFAVLQAMGVPSVVPVDTLDYSSEGIMLLTNDSMYKALLAKTAKENWQCLYKLKVLGEVTEKFIMKSQDKLTYQGEKLPGINIKVEEPPNEKESSYTWLTVVAPASVSHVALKEHFKRHNILVSRLMRLTYGPYSLDNINAGDVHEVPIKVIEKNIVKEGEELPSIENLTEVGPKKRRLTRRETKLKNKGLLDPQDIRERTRLRSSTKPKQEIKEDVEDDIMDDEDFEDDIDDDEVEEVKPRKGLDRKRDNNRQFTQPKKTNAFEKDRPLKGRFVGKSSEKSYKNTRRRGEDEDMDNDDDVFEKKAPSGVKSSYKPKGQYSSERKPSKGGRQEYKSKKLSGGFKKRSAPREDDD